MSGQESRYAHPEFLADTEWLTKHLVDKGLRIVDTDVDSAYQRGHIPGAVLIPDNYEKDPDSDRVHILPPRQFADLMEFIGIGDDTLVVAYDNSMSLYAGRLWWALKFYGHDNVKILNGGWRKWIKEGRPVSIDPPEECEGVRFTPNREPTLIESTEALKGDYKKNEVVVWDVRSRGEYSGENPRRNLRPGHIPGARHLEWLEMMDGTTHTFKPAVEMRRALKSRGITPDKQVVAH